MAETENEALENLAVEELLQEAKRAKERARDYGSLAWQKSSVPPTNKRFLNNMLVSTLRDADRQNKKQSFRNRRRYTPERKHLNNHRKRRHSETQKELDYGEFDAYKYSVSEHSGRSDNRKQFSSSAISKWEGSNSLDTDSDGKELDKTHRNYKSRKRHKHHHLTKEEPSSHKSESKKSRKSKPHKSKSSKSKSKHKKKRSKHKHRHKERSDE